MARDHQPGQPELGLGRQDGGGQEGDGKKTGVDAEFSHGRADRRDGQRPCGHMKCRSSMT